MHVLEKMFLSCETCVQSNCLLLNNKICLKYMWLSFHSCTLFDWIFHINYINDQCIKWGPWTKFNPAAFYLSACTKHGKERSCICVLRICFLFIQFSVGFSNCSTVWYFVSCTLNILAHFTSYHLSTGSLGCKHYSWYATQVTLSSDQSITKQNIKPGTRCTPKHSSLHKDTTPPEHFQKPIDKSWKEAKSISPPPHTHTQRVFHAYLRYFSIDLCTVMMM